MSKQSATTRAAEAKFLAETRPAVEQFRAIAARSGNALFLSNGPVNPDHELLELCTDALHYATAANQAYDGRPAFSCEIMKTAQQVEEWRQADERAIKVYDLHTEEVTLRLRRAKKM